nr:DUF3450 domain-containing protein [Ruminococcus sp.]
IYTRIKTGGIFIHTLIENYKKSHILIKERIKFLTQQKKEENLSDEKNIEQRLRLLYAEKSQLNEIIEYLEKYVERVEKRGKA